MSEIVAALFGAAAAGIFQTAIMLWQRSRERAAMLRAIASEVGSLCRIIRAQQYLEAHEAICDAADNGEWDGKTWVVDIRSHYFSVFEALSTKLGELNPKHASTIVNFYVMCKSVVDSVRPDGPVVNDEDLHNKLNAVRMVAALLREVLATGDKIVQFPNPALTYEPLR